MTPTLSSLVESLEREHSDPSDSLFSVLYADLHRMARRELAKRGAGMTLSATTLLANAEELTRISEALDELATVDPRLAEVVDLKFFCGFSFAEIAAMQAISERTVQRDWEKARIYLHQALHGTAE
jgi:RNA polymerase sigma factor (sigma-70 family)